MPSASPREPGAVALSEADRRFLAMPMVAALTTVRPNDSLHTAPVRFSVDAEAGLARVMTVVTAQKARNVLAAPGSRATLCQVDGFRWISLEGPTVLRGDAEGLMVGIRSYRRRYQAAPPMPLGLVMIEIAIDRVMRLNL